MSGSLADKLDSALDSGIPKEGRRSWIVPRWLKDAFVAFAVICVAAVLGFKAVQHFGGNLERAKAAVEADDLDGSPAPPIRLPARGGGVIDLAQYRGKLVLVNFWATWCPPCRDEEPSLAQMSRSFEPDSLQVLAVSVDDGWEPIEKFFGAREPAYRVALDEGGKISLRYGTNKFPESYLVDPSGSLRVKFVGPRNWMDPSMFSLLEGLGARRSQASVTAPPMARPRPPAGPGKSG
jgi:thiol-disulfide isomerase/thioredoxin